MCERELRNYKWNKKAMCLTEIMSDACKYIFCI